MLRKIVESLIVVTIAFVIGLGVFWAYTEPGSNAEMRDKYASEQE